MKNNFITKIIGATLAAAMMIGAGVGINAAKQATGVNAASAQKTSFSDISGNVDSNISYACYQGGAGTAPAVNSSAIRLYQGNDTTAGGLLVIKTTSDFSMTSITIGSTMNTTIGYVVGTEYTSSQAKSVFTANEDTRSIAANGTTTISNIETTVVTFACLGTTKNTRLYLNEISVTYTTVSSEPTISFSEDSISGEEGEEFSFTYETANLTEDITWSPANNDTDVIDYSVNESTKTVSGTLSNPGTVTLTATSGTASDSVVFNVVEHITKRRYTITSTTAVSGSGDVITDAAATFKNTYTTKEQLTSGKEMTLTISGLSKKVTINKLVFSMRSNGSAGAGYATISVDGKNASYLSGNADGVSFEEFGDEGTTYGTTYRDITWDNLSYVAISSIVIKIHATVNSLYCQWFDIYFNEEENVDVVTAISVTPNTWSGYDSQAINVSDYTVSVTKNGEAGTASDYTFQGIGYMNGDVFVARNAQFSNGYPVVADTRLCWKANYPSTPGGSTYLCAYVTLTVQADIVSAVALSGNLTTNSFTTGDEWNTSGLVVTATYASSAQVNVTADATFNFYSDDTMTNEVATPADLGTGANQNVYIKATYSGVSNGLGYEQAVSVVKVSRVTFVAGEDVGEDTPVPSVSKNGIVIATAASNGTMTRNDNYRVYSGKDVTITSSTENIVKINFFCSTAGYNKLSGDGYTKSGSYGTWTGNASSVTLTSSGDQSRITKVIVTVESALYDIESTLSTTTSLSYHYEHENDTYEYTNVAIRFGSLMQQSLWNNLDNESNIAGFGVLITDDSVVGENDDIADAYDLAEVSPEITDYFMPKASQSTPVVASDKQKSDAGVTGDYYIWNLYLNVEEANFSKTFVAGAYIKLASGDIVFMKKASFSVKSLAADYLAHRNCNEQTAGGSLYNLAHYGE